MDSSSPRTRREGWGEGRRVRRQRGWAGIVMLLVVVLIVAFLAKDALLKYLGPAATVPRAAAKGQLDPATSDSGAPTPANALDRARSLQDAMQKESEKRDGGN